VEFVSITTPLVAAAGICAALGVPSAVGALLVVRRGGGRAAGLLAAGLVGGVAGVVVAAILAAAAADSTTGRTGGAHRPVLVAAAVGSGYVLAMVFLVAGVLLLPGVARSAGVRGRLILDGLILALSAFYVSWTLFVEPMHRSYLHRTVPLILEPHCLVVALPAIISLITGGIAVMAASRAGRPRGAVLVLGGALLLVALTGAGLVLAVFFASPAIVPAAAAYGVAGAVVAGTVRSSSRVMTAPPEPPWERPSTAVIPLLFVAVATVLRPFYAGLADAISVGTGAALCVAVAVQQALVRHDMRRDAIRLATSEAHFRQMAHTDALTGLANRRALLTALDAETADGRPCVLLAVDLDGFKNVNDIRGHDVGDSVLVEVAERLRGNLRPGDLAARLGGDEFAVLMLAAGDEAVSACERLLRVLSSPYGTSEGTVFLSASIGVAPCSDADDVPTMLRNADLALRYAKQQGKNRVQRYDEAYDRWVRRRTAVSDALRGACARGELMLAYQPVVALPEGRVAGVEALLRWRHPELGQVAPDEFIPIAEDSGLIDELGGFALREACRQLSLWLRDGHDLWVSVNVSVHELQCERYVARVVDALQTYRVPPGRVVVEVTEHAVALDMEGLVGRLDELRTAGIRVALDDFGSGYSSLGQLRTLPVDILKIDRTLIEPAGSAPLIDVVVGLGNRLELDVVAEGITDDVQRGLLERARCRYGQGELFGPAMPAERVEALFGRVVTIPVQHAGPVDSNREMRQS
jgi:diguanylate cyclase (GGDEF)-like protein